MRVGLALMVLLAAGCRPAPPTRAAEAAPRPDAGLDAGQDAGPDAGEAQDAGPAQDAGSEPDAGPAADAGARSTTLACGEFAPLATPDELDLTPRPDSEAESLALEARPDAMVADADLYRRVASELAAIRAAQPELAQVQFVPRYRAGAMLLDMDEAGTAAIHAGTLPGWDCLNAYYLEPGLSIEELTFGGRASIYILSFPRRLSPTRLAAEYARLPHVRSAEGNAVGGFGIPASDLCLSVEGTAHVYLFQLAQGRDDGGHRVRGFGFLARPNGGLERLGSFEMGQAPAPAWWTDRPACTGSLL